MTLITETLKPNMFFRGNIAHILRRILKLNVFFRDNIDDILGRSMRLNMFFSGATLLPYKGEHFGQHAICH